MPAIFWFYGLTAIGAGMIAFTLAKTKSVFTVSLVSFLILSFMTVSEFIVLTTFGAYAYKPGVFPDPFADSVVGYIWGNYFIWTGAANLVVNFSLGNRWIVLLAGVFMLIETLFVALGIYEHHWWKTYMTGITVIVAMNVTTIWVARLNEQGHRFLRYFSFYLLALLFIHVPTHILLLTGKQHYSLGLVENFYRDSILFGLPYHALVALVFALFGCLAKKGLWQLAPVPLYLLSDFILVKMNILIFLDHWNFLCLAVFRAGCLALFLGYKKYVCAKLSC